MKRRVDAGSGVGQQQRDNATLGMFLNGCHVLYAKFKWPQRQAHELVREFSKRLWAECYSSGRIWADEPGRAPVSEIYLSWLERGSFGHLQTSIHVGFLQTRVGT